MKLKYFLICFFAIIVSMNVSYKYFVRFTEASSYLWYENRHKKLNFYAEVLVLGDSQLLSGISAATIAELESISPEKVVFMVRPSEQPEGMLDQYLTYKSSFPNLRKIYLNLSPISLSKNSVTDAHKELFFSFGTLQMHQLTDSFLRKAYFSNNHDLLWKILIEVFPYLGLNQNFSSLFGIVPSSATILGEEMNYSDHFLQKTPSISIIKTRLAQNEFLKVHFESKEYWTWKDFGIEHKLGEKDSLPKGSSLAFLKKRNLSIQLIEKLKMETEADHIDIICLDLPFSPELESDITANNIRFILNDEIAKFGFKRVIRVGPKILDHSDYFTDFTHLNAKGRDALKTYLLKNKVKSI